MRFVIATQHYAGLGFAIRLKAEGHDVLLAVRSIDDRRLVDAHARVGDGLVPKRPLGDVLGDRESLRDAYWIWDENHSVEANEILRAEGFKVLGGSRYCDTMEHDRDACLARLAPYGLHAPPSHAFDRVDDARAFLEQNPDTAFVFKPDRGETFETWLPQSEVGRDANLELRHHLASVRDTSPFILQERKDGVEANLEVWFVRGEPRFAFMTLESKPRLAGDLGDLASCAFDFAFVVPVDGKAVRETVGRLFPMYAEMQYTGFGDANVIASRDGIWFLEKCERFGYNAHPNVLWTLNRSTLATTFASLIDGDFQPDFSPGFGATCTMYMDHRADGKAIHVPDGMDRQVYLYDARCEDGQLKTCGYYDDVLLATGFGYTMAEAWEAALANARAIRFPGRSFRIDGAGTDYPSSPIRRYEALQAMGFV